MKQTIKFNTQQYLDAYGEVFDIVRIVDPIQKEVIKYKDCKAIPGSETCYSLWQINEECKDCISLKALNNQKTHMKIQHISDKMFLMFAVPLKAGKEALVLELIKDITDSLEFETVVQGQGHFLRNIVQDLNTLILRDPLTNLYNRRYIDQMLPEEIARCTDKHPLSVAMVDIDHFKNINDTYGHSAGDVVIKKFSKTLSKFIRDDVDWAGRYGGEEFIICLPNTDNKKAYKVLERIRQAVEKINIKVEGKEIVITSSFGLYTVRDNELTTADLIKCADDKLYEAKKRGRNKVVS